MDKKPTDSEIVKALECCIPSYNKKCDMCPYEKLKPTVFGKTLCSEYMRQDIFALINRLQAENERLGKFKEYFDCLYGLNLEVLGWHENGNPIDFDEFYDSAIADMENAEKEMVGDTGV